MSGNCFFTNPYIRKPDKDKHEGQKKHHLFEEEKKLHSVNLFSCLHIKHKRSDCKSYISYKNNYTPLIFSEKAVHVYIIKPMINPMTIAPMKHNIFLKTAVFKPKYFASSGSVITFTINSVEIKIAMIG